ncbi:MAG: DUF2304 domain-containing protein [Anaerolineales bacterium]|jgi:hypothetical protein|nr:DUF2304 domain-containing protein [Anaerolineales bacterium]HJO33829.1 DUF2304 domain-containing protein [Anaerolineales bacterium]|tara:strand:+ start:1056 stop:1433 length:378 start_codon:yes stop_codon:yes gene_type:complete
MFPDRLTLFVSVAAFGLLLLVLEMVRRRALAEKYSLLWLLMAGAILVLALARPALDRIAPVLGIYYAPSALFVAGFVGLLVILLYFSAVITQLTRQNRIAAQQLGILQARIETLENALAQAPNDD